MMRKVYLDSCIAIYLVEEHSVYCAGIEATLAKSNGIVWYSGLTELECLVLPLRLKRNDLVEKFNRFFALNVQLTMPDSVYREAARLRAEYGLKTPDALHLSTARFHDCSELWTNDDRLAGLADGVALNAGGGFELFLPPNFPPAVPAASHPFPLFPTRGCARSRFRAVPNNKTGYGVRGGGGAMMGLRGAGMEELSYQLVSGNRGVGLFQSRGESKI